jgi:hypothetical protein
MGLLFSSIGDRDQVIRLGLVLLAACFFEEILFIIRHIECKKTRLHNIFR